MLKAFDGLLYNRLLAKLQAYGFDCKLLKGVKLFWLKIE